MIFSQSLGLQRIRIFVEGRGTEHGTPEWCIHWLLEEEKEFFGVLNSKWSGAVSIDRYSKKLVRSGNEIWIDVDGQKVHPKWFNHSWWKIKWECEDR